MNVMTLVEGVVFILGGLAALQMVFRPTIPDAQLDESQRLARQTNRPFLMYGAPFLILYGAVRIFMAFVGGK